MELIEATDDNLDALITRWFALAKSMEEHSELNKLVYAGVEEVPEEEFRTHLNDEAVTEYLIVDDGETIGFLTLREGHHPSRQYSQYLRIVNIAIDEDYRSRGYGTAVIERVKELAQQRGCDHLKVSCEWHNEGARRFYRDLNFQPKQVEYVQPLE